MANILQELTIGVAPEEVFEAIATPEGIRGWWSNRVEGEPRIGAYTEIRFDSGDMLMEIIELEAAKKVHWKVRRSPHDWEGSIVTWDLEPIPQGTRLFFGHRNLTMGPTGYSIEDTRAGWEYFLGSMKAYLEVGKGTPYIS